MRKFKKTLASAVLAVTLMGGTIAYASAFKDVDNTNWAYNTIEWGVQSDIVSGYPDGTFKPNNTVTEEEFLALLVRSFEGKDLDTVSGSKWSDPYYEVAKTNNYPVSGKRDSKISRTSVAEIIVGTQGKNYTGVDAIQYMLGTGLSDGKTSATITGYVGSDTLTRAEAVQFIRNVLTNAPSKELLPRPTAPSPKSELPSLPVPTENVIGKSDSVLAAQAGKVETTVSTLGYSAGYNGDMGSILVRNAQGGTIMSYTDNRSKGSEYTVVVTTAGLQHSDTDKANLEYIDAIVAAIQALGIPVDSKLSDAMVDALGEGKAGATVKYDSFTVDIVSVGYGKLAMYLQ